MTITYYDKRQRLAETTRLHQVNLLKTLEHRLQVAKAKGEQALIRQLEAEKSYYLS